MSTSNFDQQKIKELGGKDAGINRAATVAKQEKVEPKTPDGENLVEVKRTIKYYVNGESHAIVEDGVVNQKSLDIINKITGAVVRIEDDGNISIQTGTPGQNGKYCGGKFQVNARGGTLQKLGGSAYEYTGSKTSAVQKGIKGGSDTSESSTKDVVACSKITYGDDITECHGHEYIRGRNITLDAGDVLTLLAKEKIILQAGPTGGGEITMRCGKRTLETDINDEWIKSQNIRVTTEETNMTYDPRGSQNLITTGHFNNRVLGDYVVNAVGVGRMQFGGTVLAAPLVTDMRTSAFDISCALGNLSMITHVGSQLYSAGVKKWPDMGGLVGGVSTKAMTTIKQDATVNVDIDAGAIATFKAKGVATVESEALMTVKGAAVDIKADVVGTNIKYNKDNSYFSLILGDYGL